MAKFKRYDSRNKKANANRIGYDRRITAHMENKYFKKQRTHEIEQFLSDDIDDYLGDHYISS